MDSAHRIATRTRRIPERQSGKAKREGRLSRDDAVGCRAGSPDPAVSPREAGYGDPALQGRTGHSSELRATSAPTAGVQLSRSFAVESRVTSDKRQIERGGTGWQLDGVKHPVQPVFRVCRRFDPTLVCRIL